MKINTSLGVLPIRLPKGGLALAGFVLLMVAVLACKKEVETVATSLRLIRVWLMPLSLPTNQPSKHAGTTPISTLNRMVFQRIP